MGPQETITGSTPAPSRVYVLVSAPAGTDPESTVQAIALAAKRAAPGAEVYTHHGEVE